MIISTAFLTDAQILTLPEELVPAMKWLRNFAQNMRENIEALGELPATIEIDGDLLYAKVESSMMQLAEDRKLECHKRYIDIHVPLTDTEIIGIKPSKDLKDCIKEYDEKSDIAFYGDEVDDYYKIEPGMVGVVYPEDAHAPLIARYEHPMIKMVIKIKI